MALDIDLYENAPDSLALEQVHVYVRHGERTPVAARMTAFLPPVWGLCGTSMIVHSTTLLQRAEALGPNGEPGEYFQIGQTVMQRSAEVPTKNDEGRGLEYQEMAGACGYGALTDTGVFTTSDYGKALRDLYVNRLGFLPREYKPEACYFRSTDMARTVASLQHIVSHLYPPWDERPQRIPMPPRFMVRLPADEDLMQNYGCGKFRTLQAFWTKFAIETINPTLANLDVKLSKYIEGQPLRLDGHPKLSGVLDTIRAADAHVKSPMIKVPPEFKDPEVGSQLEKAVVAEWFGGYRQSKEIRTLGVGRVLANLQTVMAQKVKNGEYDPLKIRILSTHDTSLATQLIALEAFDGHWPDFTSSITFELFKQKPPGRLSSLFKEPVKDPAHYVRVRYQNRNLILPACSAEGSHLPGHPEICTFSAFSNLVKIVTPTNWSQQCREPVTEPPKFNREQIFFEDSNSPRSS